MWAHKSTSMLRFIQKNARKFVIYFVCFHLFAFIWLRWFNPVITIIQVGALWDYHRLKRDYVSYDEMGKNIKMAVIASEDQNFFNHWGFDFGAIKKAVKYNAKSTKIKGASTITQQTAKNIFLWKGRSWVRKGLESVYTLGIELFWNKEIILERYLNVIEMGQGVFGIEAASKYYFHKSAKDLTKSEAAWIAAVLPLPQRYDPKHPSPYLNRKHAWILRQMRYVKLPSEENK